MMKKPFLMLICFLFPALSSSEPLIIYDSKNHKEPVAILNIGEIDTFACHQYMVDVAVSDIDLEKMVRHEYLLKGFSAKSIKNKDDKFYFLNIIESSPAMGLNSSNTSLYEEVQKIIKKGQHLTLAVNCCGSGHFKYVLSVFKKHFNPPVKN